MNKFKINDKVLIYAKHKIGECFNPSSCEKFNLHIAKILWICPDMDKKHLYKVNIQGYGITYWLDEGDLLPIKTNKIK